jgi:hypothetical protein
LTDEADIVEVAAGVALNQTIQDLHLSCHRISFNTNSQIFHVLRSNQALKRLYCTSDECQRGRNWFPDEAEELEVRTSPDAYERLVDALAANVTLESITLHPISCSSSLQPYSFACRCTIDIFTWLNKLGRRYITKTNDTDFYRKAYQFLESINDSLDGLYIHLHDIPLLFQPRQIG